MTAQAAALGPQLALSGAFVLVLCVGLGGGRARLAAAAARALAALGLLSAAALSLSSLDGAATNLLRRDSAACCWEVLFCLGAFPFVLLVRADDERPIALALAATLGMSVVAVARHLLLLLIGVELMSLPAYLLVYSSRRDRRSLEAAIKYFFAGGVAGALYLFGLSAFYALTGTMSLSAVATTSPRLEAALLLMGAAALFKAGAFPLNFWLPDVYEAAAPELAAFLSTSMKAAAVLMLMRLLILLPAGPVRGLAWALPYVAAATMLAGNLLALRQERVQRLLAYSSVSHVGYLLMGVWAWLKPGAEAAVPGSLFLYLAAYLCMNTGAFLFLWATGITEVRQLKGFASRSPGLAAFFALCLLSLASVPPTSGFLVKFFVLWDAVRAGGAPLAAWAAFNSVIGLGYYFRLVKDMYLEEPGEQTAEAPAFVPLRARAMLWAAAAPTVALGVLPGARGWVEALLTR